MSTGWNVGRLAARRPESRRGEALVIDVPDGLRAAYVRPGQTCRVEVDGRVGHFVLTSRPRTSPVEIYVQRPGTVVSALLALPLGGAIRMSAPEGPGFPVAAALAGGGPIYGLAVGSGIAALRAAMTEIDRAGRAATIYAGCRHPEDLVYAADWARWAQAGFRVHRVVSGPDAGPEDRRGYVQAALLEDAPDLRQAWIFVCGLPEMVRAAREACARLGAPPTRIFTNA